MAILPAVAPSEVSEVAKLVASDSAAGDLSGHSVAISDEVIVVGAYGDDDAFSNSGPAYVFARTEGGHDLVRDSEAQKLVAIPRACGARAPRSRLLR